MGKGLGDWTGEGMGEPAQKVEIHWRENRTIVKSEWAVVGLAVVNLGDALKRKVWQHRKHSSRSGARTYCITCPWSYPTFPPPTHSTLLNSEDVSNSPPSSSVSILLSLSRCPRFISSSSGPATGLLDIMRPGTASAAFLPALSSIALPFIGFYGGSTTFITHSWRPPSSLPSVPGGSRLRALYDAVDSLQLLSR